jgi:hypothetical protein
MIYYLAAGAAYVLAFFVLFINPFIGASLILAAWLVGAYAVRREIREEVGYQLWLEDNDD